MAEADQGVEDAEEHMRAMLAEFIKVHHLVPQNFFIKVKFVLWRVLVQDANGVSIHHYPKNKERTWRVHRQALSGLLDSPPDLF